MVFRITINIRFRLTQVNQKDLALICRSITSVSSLQDLSSCLADHDVFWHDVVVADAILVQPLDDAHQFDAELAYVSKFYLILFL